MGMLRGLMTVAAIAALSGCGFYNDFKANSAVQDYRLNCTGNFTNDCESMLVDTNIVMLELARSNLARQKEPLLKSFGQDGYERIVKAGNEVIDDLIDRQEKKRPGIFVRWFLGDAQPFGDTRNHLFLESDMIELKNVIVKRAIASMPAPAAHPAANEPLSPTAAILLGKVPSTPPQPAQATVAPTVPAQPVLAQSSALDAAVDEVVAKQLAQGGGDEHRKDREILLADLNGDGTNDAVVLYTIEGQGGGNGYFQSLATFYAEPNGWTYRGTIIVGQGVQSLTQVNSTTLALKVLSVGPDDANCCPTMENIHNYTWDGNTFIQDPNS